MMHADEVNTGSRLARRLLAAQFPQWAGLPLEPVRFFGTDNAIYRLGDELSVRLPRREQNVLQLHKELRWLPGLAPRLPLAIPEPVAKGEPGEGYPLEWAVYRWLPGEAAYETPPDKPERELAAFLLALQRIDPTGGPPPGEHNFFQASRSRPETGSRASRSRSSGSSARRCPSGRRRSPRRGGTRRRSGSMATSTRATFWSRVAESAASSTSAGSASATRPAT